MKAILKQLCKTSLIVSTLSMTGCSTIFNSHIEYAAVKPEQYPVLTAMGYAPIEQQSGQDIETKILQAMTASKAQAYQELAAQVHGLSVNISQNIGALVLQDTSLATQVMGIVRGAKVKQSFKQGNNTYVTELSLDMRRAADLFAEIEEPEVVFKEAPELPPMMLFETPELIEQPEPESVVTRLPMEERLAGSSFQTLIFEISGVKMAVPLVELGGIHPFVPLQHIIGKPDWYAGFVQLKGKSVNCIDGAKWLLTGKRSSKELDNSSQNDLEYQFIIMLNDTNWGIACHILVDTVLMFKEEVKWRDTDIKRPWMAGLVKEQMCAMLDTYELTDMLDAGLTSVQK